MPIYYIGLLQFARLPLNERNFFFLSRLCPQMNHSVLIHTAGNNKTEMKAKPWRSVSFMIPWDTWSRGQRSPLSWVRKGQTHCGLVQDFRHAQYSLQFSCSLRHEEEARRQSGRLEVVVNCDCTYNNINFYQWISWSIYIIILNNILFPSTYCSCIRYVPIVSRVIHGNFRVVK